MTDPESLLAHAGFVRAIARAAVRGDDEVDDVVQDTWLSALQGRPKGSVRGWLASIVRRRAADLARLRGAQRRRDRAAAKEEAVVAEDVVERAEVGRGLVGDVLALDEPYRTALLLRYHEGLAPREIAARLGLPVETVRTHVKRGLERLRERLDARHGDRRAWILALAPWVDPAPPPPVAPLALATKVALAVAALAVVVAVPLWLLRAEAPGRFAVAGGAVEFGRIAYGEERVVPVTLRNETSRDVLVSDVSANCSCFRVDPGFQHLVARGAEVQVSVRLVARDVPVAPLRDKRLTVHSDDPDAPRIEVPLRGEVVAGPALSGREPPPPASPKPVDLAAIDPQRDVHGVVVDEDGKPIAGATVQVVQHPWMRLGLLLDYDRWLEEIVGDAVPTASDGSFALRLDPTDVVDLRVSAPERAPVDLVGRAAGSRVRVVVERPVRLDVTTHDEAGKPLAGVALTLLGQPPGSGLRIVRAATTDATGGASFAALPPRWGVSVIATLPDRAARAAKVKALPPSGSENLDVVLAEGTLLHGTVTVRASGAPVVGARVGVGWPMSGGTATDERGAFTLRFDPTANLTRDLHLVMAGFPRVQAPIGDRTQFEFRLAPGRSAVGRVLSADGAPVAGAYVAAAWSHSDASSQEMNAVTARTDAQGRFRLEGLHPFYPHRFSAWAHGLGDARSVVPFDTNPVADLGDVRLSTVRSLAGRVVGDEGQPIAGRRVRLSLEDAVAEALREERITDEDGRFAFGLLAAGKYVVSTDKQLRRVVAEVPEEGAAEGVTLAIPTPNDVPAASAPPRRRHSVRVVVTGQDGTPVEDAQLQARSTDGALGGIAETSADGHTVLEVLPDRLTLKVLLPMKHSNRWLPVERELVGDEEDLRIVLPDTAKVTGRVLAIDGSPLPNAEVVAQRNGNSVGHALTDADGAFVLGRPPGGGPIDVVLTGTTYVPGSYGSTGASYHLFTAVRSGVPLGTTDVELRAEVPASDRELRVRVLGPDGAPLARAEVRISVAHGVPARVERTDASGIAAFRDLAALPADLWVQPAPEVGRIWLPPLDRASVVPQGQEVVVRMREGVMFRVRVLDPDGAPARNVRVKISSGDAVTGAVPTDGEGWVALPTDPDRSPRLDVEVDHPASASERWKGRLAGVDVRAGEVTLRLAR